MVGLYLLGSLVVVATPDVDDYETPTEVVKKPTTSNTLQPTDTPKPTSNEEDEQSEEYISEVLELNESQRKAFNTFSEIFTSNPTAVYTDESVMTEVALSAATVKANYKALQSLEPPKKYEDVHSKLLSSYSKFDESMDLLAEGIDNFDSEKVTEASRKLQDGTSLMNEANELLEGK